MHPDSFPPTMLLFAQQLQRKELTQCTVDWPAFALDGGQRHLRERLYPRVPGDVPQHSRLQTGERRNSRQKILSSISDNISPTDLHVSGGDWASLCVLNPNLRAYSNQILSNPLRYFK